MNYLEVLASQSKPLKFERPLPSEVHPDYRVNGIAPRIGHALGQLSEENSDLGHLAAGLLTTGDHSGLKILADKLDEDGHPVASAFNWRHAERGINIDRALKAEIGRHRIMLSGNPGDQPQTPGWTFSDWSSGTRGNLSKRRALRVVQEHVPDASPKDVAHSVLRLMDQQDLNDFHGYGEHGYPIGTAPDDRRRVFDEQSRTKSLGQEPAPIHTYPDTRPLKKQVFSRKGDKVKFSVDPNHSDFHRQMDENPENTLTPMAYADFLQERGMDGPAEGIRAGVRTHGVGLLGADIARLDAHRRLPPGAFSVYATPFMDDHLFHLVQKSTTRPDHIYHWTGLGDKDKVGDIVRGVVNSGGFSEVAPDEEHLYFPSHSPTPDIPEHYSRLRTGPEYKDLMLELQSHRNNWYSSKAGTPFPSDHFLHTANYFHKAGDPRGDIIGYHADNMDGFKDNDPAQSHIVNTEVNRPLSTHMVPLSDGSSLHVENHGHYMEPGVHAVSMSWRPKGVEGSFHAHFLPNEARTVADKFLHADPEAGKALHKALDQGDRKGNFKANQFEKYGEALKFQGYKAPSGGMIVDNTFFPGGSMLPKLTAPKKFAKGSKWEKLKKKLKLKPKILTVNYDDPSSCN